MRYLRFHLILCAAALLLASPLMGCESKPKVVVMQEPSDKEEEDKYERKTEEQLREEYEKKKIARANQPEPELDPNEPREKFELVWRMGKAKLSSIYNERNEMIAMLRRVKLEDKREAAIVKPLLDPMIEFGIGRSSEEMERAPQEICKFIEKLRAPSSKLIEPGTKELEKLKALEESYEEMETKRLEACTDACKSTQPEKWIKAFVDGAGAAARSRCQEEAKEAGNRPDKATCEQMMVDACGQACLREGDDKKAGKAVYQKDWDKLDEQKKRWSKPVRAGKQILLVVRSILDEALVLAEYGPRRAQLGLRDCLSEVAKTPFELDLAQEALTKAIERSKWYRELN